jgi:hypothetical protein
MNASIRHVRRAGSVGADVRHVNLMSLRFDRLGGSDAVY